MIFQIKKIKIYLEKDKNMSDYIIIRYREDKTSTHRQHCKKKRG